MDGVRDLREIPVRPRQREHVVERMLVLLAIQHEQRRFDTRGVVIRKLLLIVFVSGALGDVGGIEPDERAHRGVLHRGEQRVDAPHAHADERKPASIGVVYGWDLSQRRLEVAHLRVVAVRIVDEERVSALVRRKLRRSDNQIAVRCQVLPDHGILRDVVRLAEPVQDDGEESAGRTRIARRRDRRAQQTRVGRCVTHRLFQTVRAVGEPDHRPRDGSPAARAPV